MFERFTNRARRVVVLAQEEARMMRHNYIGTEHLLLGLLHEGNGIGARTLERFGMTLESTRAELAEMVGPGKRSLEGHIPFTPRAKRAMELSLRECLDLHHGYVGTEHLLLGLIRLAEGVGPEIMARHRDLLEIRMAVLDLVAARAPEKGRRWRLGRGTLSGQPDVSGGYGEPGEDGEDGPAEEMRTTPAADSSLAEAARLAGADPVGSHHLLLATLADPEAAAARALTALGVDLEGARAALRDADVAGTSDELPEQAGRRQMVIRLTGDRLTLEVADQVLVGLGREALSALEAGAGQAGEPGTIRGDLPASASLSRLWEAIRDSLEDIRRRAGSPEDTGAHAAG